MQRRSAHPKARWPGPITDVVPAKPERVEAASRQRPAVTSGRGVFAIELERNPGVAALRPNWSSSESGSVM